MSVRDEIRKNSRIARMRQGQLVPEYVDIPSADGVRAALVPLTEAELAAGIIYSMSDQSIPETFQGLHLRQRRAVESDVFHALREIGDPSEQIWPSIEAMTKDLEGSDIDYINMHLASLMNYASPKMDRLSEEDMDFLGKHLRKIALNELTGRQWAAAKVLFSATLPPEQRDRFFGPSSTNGSTTMSESEEST